MNLSTLLLGTALVLGTTLSGSVLAHGGYDRGRGWDDHGHRHAYQERYRHERHHRKHHHHDHDRRYWREEWRPRHDHDSWYGLHLFLGGH